MKSVLRPYSAEHRVPRPQPCDPARCLPNKWGDLGPALLYDANLVHVHTWDSEDEPGFLERNANRALLSLRDSPDQKLCLFGFHGHPDGDQRLHEVKPFRRYGAQAELPTVVLGDWFGHPSDPLFEPATYVEQFDELWQYESRMLFTDGIPVPGNFPFEIRALDLPVRPLAARPPRLAVRMAEKAARPPYRWCRVQPRRRTRRRLPAGQRDRVQPPWWHHRSGRRRPAGAERTQLRRTRTARIGRLAVPAVPPPDHRPQEPPRRRRPRAVRRVLDRHRSQWTGIRCPRHGRRSAGRCGLP